MNLHFVEYGSGGEPLIILHGLLGSERNWYSVAKKLCEKYRVIIPDQRNHGISPHHDDHSIASMKKDLVEFVDGLRLNKFFLLGHSMGGHVAMAYAYVHPERLHGLLVEDIAPRSYGKGLIEILNTMKDLDLSKFSEKKQVEQALTDGIKSPAVRSFVITNLIREVDRLAWRINLPALVDFAAHEISRFQPVESDRYVGPTLFLGGEKSMYKVSDDEALIRQHFPKTQIAMVKGAGHWIHHEQVDLFCDLVMSFLQTNTPTSSANRTQKG